MRRACQRRLVHRLGLHHPGPRVSCARWSPWTRNSPAPRRPRPRTPAKSAGTPFA